MLDNLPNQKIKRTNKTASWGKKVIDQYIAMSDIEDHYGRSPSEKKLANYDLYNGRIDIADFKYVTDPYDIEADLPSGFQHYDKISPKINLLIGEEWKRPFNFKCVAVNSSAISDMQKKKKELLMQALLDAIQPKFDPNYQQQPQTPAEIEEYMSSSYAGLQEITGQRILEYLKHEQELPRKFNEGFFDALVAGEEIYWVGIVAGEPVCRVVNPLDLTIIASEDSQFIDEASAIIEDRYMTVPEIVDEFHHELSDAEIADLENGINNSIKNEADFFTRSITVYEENTTSNGKEYNANVYRVTRVEWKSFRKIGFIQYLNEVDGGETSYSTDKEKWEWDDIVDAEIFDVPDYAKKKDGCYYFDGMKYSEDWISEWWTYTRIGTDLYVGLGPVKHQYRSMDNPSNVRGGYTGFIYNSRNSVSTSIVDRLKPFNYLYDIIYWRIELALAKDKGRVMLMDIAQLPSGEGWDMDKWLYYLDGMNIAFINSAEEGFQQAQGNFNQFQAIDLETGRFIDKHLQILAKLEEEMGEVSGVSRQRQGQVQRNELVGNVQQTIIQSSHITETWFKAHNTVKKRVLENLIHASKLAWKNGKKINYILDDMSRVLLDIDNLEYDNTEFGVFVSDSMEDDKALEAMRSLIHPALQAGNATLSEAAELFRDKSMTRIVDKLKKGETRREQMQQKQNEDENKRVAATIEATAKENQLERDNKLRIAEMNLLAKNIGKEGEGSNDDLLDLQREKMEKDINLKKDILEETKRKNKVDEQLKEKSLEIQRKKATSN